MARALLPILLPILMLCAWAEARAADSPGGFLFVTFKGEQSPLSEQIYFALSKDGRHWKALNHGEPVLVSSQGERGVRDPYLLRSHDGEGFILLATDLSIHRNHDWGRAQTEGSKSIMVWESPDLVNWSAPRLVSVAAEDAGCTWAPEAIHDPEEKGYMVFWASKTARDDFARQRIWASMTPDFKTFGPPFLYIEKPQHVIDTTIVQHAGRFYRLSKDEESKSITMETSGDITGDWNAVPGFTLSDLRGFEGPLCFPLEPSSQGGPARWCLMLDHYSRGEGYKAWITDDLASGVFVPAEGEFHFPFRFRHGSVLVLTQEESARVEDAHGGGP